MNVPYTPVSAKQPAQHGIMVIESSPADRHEPADEAPVYLTLIVTLTALPSSERAETEPTPSTAATALPSTVATPTPGRRHGDDRRTDNAIRR